MAELIARFEELSGRDVARAGGKGANLGEFTRARLPVPPGFVLLAGRVVLGQCAGTVDMGPFAPVRGKPGQRHHGRRVRVTPPKPPPLQPRVGVPAPPPVQVLKVI